MTRRTLTMITAAGLALSGAVSLGYIPRTYAESTGAYIDDSVITTKVKAALLEKSALKSFEISVSTNKGVVELSGFVDSTRSVLLAGKVASSVHGVSTVKNALLVKK